MDVEFEPLATTPLLLICAGAILVLLFLIVKLKLHAVPALLIVSAATAVATGIPTGSVMDLLLGGLGDTLGEIAFLIAFGVMFARLIEFSGGTKVLVDALINKLGEHRAPVALGFASLVFGIPIFFDAALLVMLPLYLGVARRVSSGSIIPYVLGPAAGLSIMHMLMPPHPGVTTATILMGADIGLVMLFGFIIAIPSWYLGGHLLATRIGRRMPIPVPEAFTGGPQVDAPYTPSNVEDAGTGSSGSTRTRIVKAKVAPPKISALISLICLPILLILLNTGSQMLVRAGNIDENSQWVQIFGLIGSVPVALLITVLVSSFVLCVRRGVGAVAIEDMLDNALKPVCSVILVTGAGGMFAAVLETSGIGDAVASSLDASGLPLPVALFVICAIMSAAVGSTTVSITTAAGLMGATIVATDPSPLQLTALVLVMAGGSGILPHVNDSGFWLMSRLLGMTVVETLKSWTIIKTMIGVWAAIFATGLYYLVSI